MLISYITKTEHYNSVLEITVSFLGRHNWEPDIYIGFSPALNLQCGSLQDQPADRPLPPPPPKKKEVKRRFLHTPF
jgi:hypothetical protein